MRDDMREKLNTEITRKQFLQFSAAALLTLFGFHNLFALLSGHGPNVRNIYMPGTDGTDHNGFGTRKFGI